jgi:small conductance mechanosensitive channel
MDLQATLQPLMEKLQGWLDGAIAMLPNVIVGVVAMALFVVLARMGRRLAARLGARLGANTAIVSLMATVVQYGLLAAGVLVVLGIVGLQKAVISILAGAGVAGLAIGFAFQDLAANFIAGVVMGFRQPFQIGDLVRTAEFVGFVETINLRNTIVRALDGRRVIVPNRMVFENPLINFHSHGKRRIEIPVGVAYDTDLKRATVVAREAVEDLDFRAEATEVEVLAEGFGASSIDFLVRYWIQFPGTDYFDARHAGVLAIKRAFDEQGISIPFPIRTLDLSRSGGDLLSDDGTADGADRAA